jgi:Spy/CpxP family protein refolding chaperone
MKKIITTSLATAALIATTWGVYAEYKPPRTDDGKRVEWQQHEDRKIEHLKSELNLTPDQEAKIRATFQSMREKIQAIREETHKNIASLLTPEQRAKFEQMKDKHRKH